MSHYLYLALLVGCLAVTVPLEFAYGFRVWRNPRRLFRVVVPGFLIFMVWDAYAIHRGHWSYNPTFTSGVKVGFEIPLEEALFFVIIPVAAISGFEAVKAGLRRRA